MKLARVFLVGAVLALVFGAGLGGGFFAARLWGRSGALRFLNTATVIQQVQALAQLVTVQYSLEKVVVLEDVKWSETFGTSRVLLIAHAVVKAGVDLSQIDPEDIRISGKSITLVLPPPRLTDVYLDDKLTQVVERTTGLLRTFDRTLEQTARQQALDDIQRAARHNGILRDAAARARTQLANLFHQLGYEQVEFREPGSGLLPYGKPEQETNPTGIP